MKVISLSMVPTQKKGEKKFEFEKIIWGKHVSTNPHWENSRRNMFFKFSH
jgi:hypothetical protein